MSSGDVMMELRKSLRDQFPGAHRFPVIEEGVEGADLVKDEALVFAGGTVNEVVSGVGFQGMSLLISRLLDEERELPLALVDGQDSFDPESYGNGRCVNLLWVRCTETDQILNATDLLLRDGNLPLILMDLHLLPKRELGRIPNVLWHRFRTEARDSGSALVVLSPMAMVPSAHSRYFIEGEFTLDHLEKISPSLRVVRDDVAREGRVVS